MNEADVNLELYHNDETTWRCGLVLYLGTPFLDSQFGIFLIQVGFFRVVPFSIPLTSNLDHTFLRPDIFMANSGKVAKKLLVRHSSSSRSSWTIDPGSSERQFTSSLPWKVVEAVISSSSSMVVVF